MQKGSIVVCIDDGNWWSDSMEYFNKLPVKGELYTIREFFPNCIDPNGQPGVALEEIIGKFDEVLMHTGQLIKMELHFKISRFKEVLPPQTISIEDFMDSKEEINDVRRFRPSNRVRVR